MFFFFNHTATCEIYTLSLHDALPILIHASPLLLRELFLAVEQVRAGWILDCGRSETESPGVAVAFQDRKSTRLNSSHVSISYAVFCLKKKTTIVYRLSELTGAIAPSV